FNGRTTRFEYDVMNQLTNKVPDAAFGAPAVSFTYTPTGQRATMSDAAGITTYQYNERDWLTNKTTPQGALAYNYDRHGNLTNSQSSNSNGLSVTYTWDPLNRLSTVSEAQTGQTTYSYDLVGNLEQTYYPNGVVTVMQHDALHRLTNSVSAKLG